MTELNLKLWMTFALVAVDAIWIALAGDTFDLASLSACIGFTALLAAIGYFYTRVRPDERLGAVGIEAAFLTIFSAAACVFSYLVTTTNRPLIDATLVQWDSLFGFDWFAYMRFTNTHHWIAALFSFVYQTTLPKIALVLVILPVLGRLERVREMTLLVMISSILCIVIAGIIPSAGALGYFHPPASFYAASHPVVDLAYKQSFFDLRAGTLTHFSLTDLKGLVAFPSYHVALAVTMMIAFRGMPFWFWSIVILNTLTILATPIDGGHHLVDGLGGAALALVTAAIVIRLRAWLAQPRAAETSEIFEGLAGQEA